MSPRRFEARSDVFQVFFVDDPDDPEWKVVLEKQPRSRRHSQEDDDKDRPDAAEHVFDARGLETPIATTNRVPPRHTQAQASTSRAAPADTVDSSYTSGENVSEAGSKQRV